MSAESQRRIRKPGEAFELTDEELMQAPARMLTPEQRRRRRRLRNNVAKQKTRARRAERKAAGEAKVKFCQATRANGKECTGYAVHGSKHCFAHLTDEEREKLNMYRPKRETGPVAPNTIQLMKEAAETAAEKILDPYFRANGLKLLGFDENGAAVIQDLGEESGLMLHGESKDGEIIMTNFPDISGRVNINEKLLDRLYGKPKQTQVLEGGIKPIQVQPVRTVERSQTVSHLLAQVGAVGGAQNPAALPASPGSDDIGGSGGEVLEGRVLPLRNDQNGSDQG